RQRARSVPAPSTPRSRADGGCFGHERWNDASGRERDLDPAVAATFVADPQHADAADLGDVAHVRASARLEVDAGDAEQPHPAGAPRRLYAHRLHELRTRVELFVGDPHGFGLDAARNELIRAGLDFL